MKHASTRALHAYWDQLRAGRSAPERGDLDPGAIKGLLGDVFLLELGEREPYLVRLAGTRICALLGHELKGRSFAEAFYLEDLPELAQLLDGVAQTAVPAVAGLLGETTDGRKVDIELLILPLRLRGRTHARLLGSLAPLHVPYWVGSVPLMHLRLVSTRLVHMDEATDDREGIAARREYAATRLRLLPGGRS
jgi:hypothetical protein